MIFWKSGFADNYYRRANFKSRYLKTTLGTFFVKTVQDKALKLCRYVPLMSFHILSVSIFLILIFSIFMGFYGWKSRKNAQNIRRRPIKWPIKWEKNKNFKIENTQTVKRNPKTRWYMPNNKVLGCSLFPKNVPKVVLRYRDLKFARL